MQGEGKRDSVEGARREKKERKRESKTRCTRGYSMYLFAVFLAVFARLEPRLENTLNF